MDLGLLLVRSVVGLLMAGHGAQKLFGWFGGYGIDGTGAFFESIGFRPGRLFAAIASLVELAGGALVTLGFLGPVGPAALLSVMIVAAVSVHWPHGVFAGSNGIEVPLLYAVTGAGLALSGYGGYSLDALLGLTPVWTPGLTFAILAAGILGGVVNLLLRRTTAAVGA
jgi:putative oxidoreductase